MILKVTETMTIGGTERLHRDSVPHRSRIRSGDSDRLITGDGDGSYRREIRDFGHSHSGLYRFPETSALIPKALLLL